MANKIGDYPFKIRCEIGTANASRCQVPKDHTIGPKIAKNGSNYSTAPKRIMGRSACGNLVHGMNLSKARRTRSSYIYYPYFVIFPANARCCSRLCNNNTSKRFVQSPILSGTSRVTVYVFLSDDYGGSVLYLRRDLEPNVTSSLPNPRSCTCAGTFNPTLKARSPTRGSRKSRMEEW